MVLFAAGSMCFLVAPMPWFLQLVGPQADGAVFFVGSLLFTSAASVQWLTTVDVGTSGRRFAWQPRRLNWWSSGLQLVGTVAFNVTTFLALSTAIDEPSYDRLVWRPDAVGSIFFLASGYLAYVQVSGDVLRRPPRTKDGGIATVNLLGCLAFGVSAVAAYVVPGTDSEVDVAIANAATSAGALGFFTGAVLLWTKGAPSSGPVRPRGPTVARPGQ